MSLNTTSINDKLGPGGLENVATLSTDANGNVTGLVGPGGAVLAQLPIGVPSGMSWLTDTISAFDIYAQGFVQRPTIFFDPQASDTNGRGTYAKPYSTADQLEAAISRVTNGNTVAAPGTVIGFRRGSKLHGGLRVKLAGTSADPAYIVPYGDAEDLPIITGATVYANTGNPATGWSVTSDSRVYKLTSATEYDVFDATYLPIHSQRFTKVAAGASEAATIAALVAAGAGTRSFYSGAIYLYPFDSVVDWTSIEVNNAARVSGNRVALDVRHANIAASGYLTIAGIHARTAGNTAINIRDLGTELGNITSINNVNVIGCMLGNVGTDRSSVGADTGMQCGGIYGISNALRAVDCNWRANYSYNAVNNASEFGYTDRLLHEYNKADYTQGPCIVELYQDSSNAVVRYNIGKGRYAKALTHSLFGHKGLWVPGYDSGLVRKAAQSASNTFHHNIMLELGQGDVVDLCGTGILYYNNYQEHDGGNYGAGLQFTAGTDVATTFTVKNNILNIPYGATAGANVNSNTGCTGTFSNNWYRRPDGTGFLAYGGVNYNGMTEIINGKDLVGGDGPDPLGKNTAVTFSSGRGTSASIASGVLSTGTAIAGYTEIDRDGAYKATPALGPYYVGA